MTIQIETIEIRLVIKGRPDDLKVMAARWMKANKFEALDFLAQARKSEILAEEGAPPSQIQVARIESLAFYKYLTDVLTARSAADRGDSFSVPSAPGEDGWDDEDFSTPQRDSTTSKDILSNL